MYRKALEDRRLHHWPSAKNYDAGEELGGNSFTGETRHHNNSWDSDAGSISIPKLAPTEPSSKGKGGGTPLYNHCRQSSSFYDIKQLNNNNTNSNKPWDYATSYFEPGSNESNRGLLRSQTKQREEDEILLSLSLIEACRESETEKVKEICKKLSKLPADVVQPIVNYQDQGGRTALSHACSGGGSVITMSQDITQLRAVDPNLADNDGNTPLHHASQAGYSEVVDFLIARYGTSLDLNCKNSGGVTPLMKAAIQGRTRCAKALLAAGASSHLRDYSRGLTAAEWAKLCGRHICAEVIVRGTKEAQRLHGYHSSSTSSVPNRSLSTSQSNLELRRMHSDEAPYYHLYAKSSMSGANWLRNKISRALGGSETFENRNRRTISNGSCALMGGATICAGSLLLPSIKPLIDQQKAKHAMANRKLTIPALHVTPVVKR